jgi:transcriptional regulator with XRE-family HTH domain
MEMQPQNRTVRPDAEAIKRLRIEKGWSVEKLAEKSICSIKTVENVEKGSSVYLSTLSKIARGLEVEYKTLLPGGNLPPEKPKPEPRVQVQFSLSIPYKEFDESKQLSGILEFLTKFLAKEGTIDLQGVGPGSETTQRNLTIELMAKLFPSGLYQQMLGRGPSSTIVYLEMSVLDMLALSLAYSQGQWRMETEGPEEPKGLTGYCDEMRIRYLPPSTI